MNYQPRAPLATLPTHPLGLPELITAQQPKGSPDPAVGPQLKGASILIQGRVPYKSFSSLNITPAYKILPSNQLQLLII